MEINSTWTAARDGKTFVVYSGTCDGICTKWITESPWDFQISGHMVDGQLAHKDGQGQSVLVWESDEAEYHQWPAPLKGDTDGQGNEKQ